MVELSAVVHAALGWRALVQLFYRLGEQQQLRFAANTMSEIVERLIKHERTLCALHSAHDPMGVVL
jgi:hypothetical protein